MSNLVIYPRGFIGNPGTTPTVRQFRLSDLPRSDQGDSVVRELYKAWVSGSSSQDKLEFIKVASLSWMRLVGHFPTFCIRQSAAYPDSYRVRFLQDVHSFVTDGRQDMSPMSYIDLIGSPSINSRIVDVASPNRSDKVIGMRYDESDFINKWLSHPMGLDNMIRTLFVLFGDQVTEGFMV